MFVRVKKVGPYQYLQIAQNRREGKRVKQSIIATLGRLDKLTASGAIDQLLRSAARFPEHRRFESHRTLICSAKAFPVPNNSLTSNKFYFSTVEDEFSVCRCSRQTRRCSSQYCSREVFASAFGPGISRAMAIHSTRQRATEHGTDLRSVNGCGSSVAYPLAASTSDPPFIRSRGFRTPHTMCSGDLPLGRGASLPTGNQARWRAHRGAASATNPLRKHKAAATRDFRPLVGRGVSTGRSLGAVQDSPFRVFWAHLNVRMDAARYCDMTIMCFRRKRIGHRQVRRERDPCPYLRI